MNSNSDQWAFHQRKLVNIDVHVLGGDSIVSRRSWTLWRHGFVWQSNSEHLLWSSLFYLFVNLYRDIYMFSIDMLYICSKMCTLSRCALDRNKSRMGKEHIPDWALVYFQTERTIGHCIDMCPLLSSARPPNRATVDNVRKQSRSDAVNVLANTHMCCTRPSGRPPRRICLAENSAFLSLCCL
jgi:hypothetical protein